MKFRNHRRKFRYKLQMNRLRLMARYGFGATKLTCIHTRGGLFV